jgi:ribosomal protein S27AE
MNEETMNEEKLYYCPHCRTKRPLKPFSTAYHKPRFICGNCLKTTIAPLDKPRVR